MAKDTRFALLAATVAVAVAFTSAFAQPPAAAVAPMGTVPITTGTTPVMPATATQRLPGNGSVHVNPAASAASAATPLQAASGVRATTRNAQERHATTATQDASGPASNTVDLSPTDKAASN